MSEGPTLDGIARRALLAASQANEAARDIAAAIAMPPAEARITKLAGAAVGLERAAQRLRDALLGQNPPAKEARAAPAGGVGGGA